MNLTLLTLILAFVGGAGLALQAPTNALLGRAAGSAVNAAFVSFLVGTLALGVFCAVARARPDAAGLRALPWYAWVGGVYGAFFVAVAAFGAPRIGMGALLTAAVAGQLIAALLLDHFGTLGLERHPINLIRGGGIVLVLIGAVMVRRG
jgi:transporter family-2 protein